MRTAISLSEIKLRKEEDTGLLWQPEVTEVMEDLRTWFSDWIITFCKERKTKLESIDPNKLKENIFWIYGGENRFLQRFLLARHNNLKKAQVMIQHMMQIRFDVLGYNMFSQAAISKDFENKGSKEEAETFEAVDKYWPIAYYGFSADSHVIMIGKLGDIKPKEFIGSFPAQTIKPFYFHFVERGNILQRYANYQTLPMDRVENIATEKINVEVVEPLENSDNEEIAAKAQTKWREVIEIYDFNGISRHQLHIHGLRVLMEVLKIGQTCFPENVSKTFFINVPWFFSAAWMIVKVVLNKETLDKIIISNKDCKDEIEKVFGSKERAEGMWKILEEKELH